MDKQSPFKFAVHLPTSYPSDLNSLQTLIHGCQNGDRMAWEELLSRYTLYMIKTIRASFKKHGRKDLTENQDVIYEVYIQVVDKILENSLPAALAPRALAGWLGPVAHSQTVEWLRKQGRRKSVIRRLEKGHTISLETPVGTEGTQTLGSMVPGDDPSEEEEDSRIGNEVEGLLSSITDMTPEKRLMFRVYLMSYDSLLDADIKEIARKRNEPVKTIRAEVKVLQGELLKREALRVRHQDLAGIACYLVQKLERRLMGLKEDPRTDKTAIAGLQVEQERQRKRHENFAKKAAAIVRPKNEEICRLLGLDAENKKIVKGISLKIFRIRKELKAVRSARTGNG